jgi:hypothetical protein
MHFFHEGVQKVRFGKISDASETVFRASGRNPTRRKPSFALREEIRRVGNHLPRFGKKSDAPETVFRALGRNPTHREPFSAFRKEIRRIGNRFPCFGKKSDASGIIFLKAIQIVTPVIANPQGEAIQRTRMDCFTSFSMTQNVADPTRRKPSSALREEIRRIGNHFS